MVPPVRNVTKFVACKDRKAFRADMREIYMAPTVAAAEQDLHRL